MSSQEAAHSKAKAKSGALRALLEFLICMAGMIERILEVGGILRKEDFL